MENVASLREMKDAFWIEMEPEDPTPLTKIAGTI